VIDVSFSNTIVGFKERPEGLAYNAPTIVTSLKGKYGLDWRQAT